MREKAFPRGAGPPSSEVSTEMKQQNAFIGIILVGFGIYFLLDQWHLPYLETFRHWPTLLIIIGAALFIHAMLAKDYVNLFPAVILIGLGIHFHFKDVWPWWPDGWAVYTLIFGLALLVRYYKERKDGLVLGLFFTAISLLNFFYASFQTVTHRLIDAIGNMWPLALIAIGFYFIIGKKK